MNFDQYYSIALQNETIDVNSNLRQWTYQYCNEFGFFQTPNPVYPLRSAEIDLAFWEPYCKRIFGADFADAHTDETNNYYHGLAITGKNIYFANSSEDPWQTAGMAHF
jgi:hypothetical protein